jgi:hypothetical protein
MAMKKKPKPIVPDKSGTKAEVRGRMSTKPTIKVKPKAPLTKGAVQNPNAPKGGTPPTGNVKVVPPKKTPPRGSSQKGGRSSRGGLRGFGGGGGLFGTKNR